MRARQGRHLVIAFVATTICATVARAQMNLQAMMIPAAKVSGTCMTLLEERAHVTFDGIECFQGLNTVPGATTRCVVRKEGRKAGMTARLKSYDPISTHMEVACIVDDHPMN